MEDKKKILDNTIIKIEQVLEKHKNDDTNTKEAYERIQKIKNRRKNLQNSN